MVFSPWIIHVVQCGKQATVRTYDVCKEWMQRKYFSNSMFCNDWKRIHIQFMLCISMYPLNEMYFDRFANVLYFAHCSNLPWWITPPDRTCNVIEPERGTKGPAGNGNSSMRICNSCLLVRGPPLPVGAFLLPGLKRQETTWPPWIISAVVTL